MNVLWNSFGNLSSTQCRRKKRSTITSPSMRGYFHVHNWPFWSIVLWNHVDERVCIGKDFSNGYDIGCIHRTWWSAVLFLSQIVKTLTCADSPAAAAIDEIGPIILFCAARFVPRLISRIEFLWWMRNESWDFHVDRNDQCDQRTASFLFSCSVSKGIPDSCSPRAILNHWMALRCSMKI